MTSSSLRWIALGVLLTFAASFQVSAERMNCKVEGDVLGPQRLTWSATTKVAEIDLESGTYRGVVSRVQQRENGQKVNFIFKGVEGEAETEFMIFPAAAGYGVVGVGYDYADGERSLATSHGHYPAACIAETLQDGS